MDLKRPGCRSRQGEKGKILGGEGEEGKELEDKKEGVRRKGG